MNYSLKLPIRIKPYFNSMEQFTIIRKVGQGAFSIVYECLEKATNRIFAVKKTDMSKLSILDRENCQLEIQIHKSLNHANIVKLIDFFTDDTNLYIVQEMCSRGTLLKLMGRRQLDDYEIMKLFRQTVLAVFSMHNSKIIMRDIKPENILLDYQQNIKLCDFGWSAHVGDEDLCKLKAGTFEYMSPECLKNDLQSFPSDVWALGVLLYELFTNSEPFIDKTAAGMLNLMASNKANLDLVKSQTGKNMITKIFKYDPNERLTMEQILTHKFFQPLFQSGYHDDGPKFNQNKELEPTAQENNKYSSSSNIKLTSAKSENYSTGKFEQSDRYKEYGYRVVDQTNLFNISNPQTPLISRDVSRDKFYKRIGIESRINPDLLKTQQPKTDSLLFDLRSNGMSHSVDKTPHFRSFGTQQISESSFNGMPTFEFPSAKLNLPEANNKTNNTPPHEMNKPVSNSIPQTNNFPINNLKNQIAYKTSASIISQIKSAEQVFNIYAKSEIRNLPIPKTSVNIYNQQMYSQKSPQTNPVKHKFNYSLKGESAIVIDAKSNLLEVKRVLSASPNPTRKLFRLDSSTNQYVI